MDVGEGIKLDAFEEDIHMAENLLTFSKVNRTYHSWPFPFNNISSLFSLLNSSF